jgi:hypothetical protein
MSLTDKELWTTIYVSWYLERCSCSPVHHEVVESDVPDPSGRRRR